VRIISGQYRGRILKSPPNLQVRPTSDRLRETLFNVLAPRIEGSTLLDLCSGSGAIGIEALSRGAKHVTFVDKSRKMCGLIEANLDTIEVPEPETEVVMADAAEFVRRMAAKGEKSWDVIFYDPPYDSDYSPVLWVLGANRLISPGGVLIVEHYYKNTLKDSVEEIRRWRLLKQGDSCLSFYEEA
jgi:16S rRNA (guanine966-N2)-methyltransferase